MKKFFPAGIVLVAAVSLPSYRPPRIDEERSFLARSSNRFAFTLMHAVLKDNGRSPGSRTLHAQCAGGQNVLGHYLHPGGAALREWQPSRG